MEQRNKELKEKIRREQKDMETQMDKETVSRMSIGEEIKVKHSGGEIMKEVKRLAVMITTVAQKMDHQKKVFVEENRIVRDILDAQARKGDEPLFPERQTATFHPLCPSVVGSASKKDRPADGGERGR